MKILQNWSRYVGTRQKSHSEIMWRWNMNLENHSKRMYVGARHEHHSKRINVEAKHEPWKSFRENEDPYCTRFCNKFSIFFIGMQCLMTFLVFVFIHSSISKFLILEFQQMLQFRIGPLKFPHGLFRNHTTNIFKYMFLFSKYNIPTLMKNPF